MAAYWTTRRGAFWVAHSEHFGVLADDCTCQAQAEGICADHFEAMAETWDAQDFGEAISEAFHDCNDVDGPHWPAVARKVADAIGFPLSDQGAIRPLDVIYARVNALGGCADPKDPAATAWAKELNAVLALIEGYGGRDPATLVPPDRALVSAAHRRGAEMAAGLYGEARS